MPAPRLELRDNPLRKLRTILGNDQKPMHQEEFARLIGVSVALVRAIESGARQMTWENSLERIGYLLGAKFDERDRGWHYMLGKDLYTFSHYKAFTEERAKEPLLKTKCLRALILRLLHLFKAVPPNRWLAFFGCVMSKIKQAADEYEIKGRAKILDQTEPLWATVVRIQDADGKRYSDAQPKVVTEFRFLRVQDIEALRSNDAGRLLDFQEWGETDPV